jgi:putative hydrolase of the HAD superfamily
MLAVFDLDDTLYPERQFVRGGLDAVGMFLAKDHGCAGAANRLHEIFDGGTRGRVFDQYLKEAGLQQQVKVDDLVQLYRNHQPKIELHRDASELLPVLVQGKTRMALVTDGWEEIQRRKLRALGVDRLFWPIVCTMDHGSDWSKPSTRAFAHVMAQCGTPAPRCVYIADNPAKDFGGPALVGWQTVLIRRPDGIHWGEPDAGHRIDLRIDDLRQVVRILGS